MRVLIAMDSFKGSCSAPEAAQAVSRGVRSVFPQAETILLPVADGGEGTVECFMSALRTGPVSVDVRGPNGQAVSAVYTRSGTKAVIEMAAAAGLPEGAVVAATEED